MNKLLDLRFVIGAFFLIVGLLLLVYSFASKAADAQEVNRWCGIVFALFGGLMVFFSFGKDAGDELLD
ncbi:MAG TPA: hypothetical protein VHK91_08850 [Flavisolibacter sp.]|jgi:uncharacterized membrane protein HdeD (DUF308 family)|nr:hypothetical protein [Flavisolibacter sp.]